MNREELIKLLQSWLTTATDDNGNPIHVIMDVDIHEIATEIIKSSLPPAEGAEKLKEMEELFNLEQQLDIPMKDRFHNSAKGKELFAAIQNKPHPTAEGAEDILDEIDLGEPLQTGEFYYRSEVLEAMNKFATLHAQRIAEKMVSERLRGELIRYIKRYGGFNYEDMTDEMLVNEYLKTREP